MFIRIYRNRYTSKPSNSNYSCEGGIEMADEITQKSLLPEITGSKLWMVKCKIGQEKVTVQRLMFKYHNSLNSDEPFQVKSVLAPEDIKG